MCSAVFQATLQNGPAVLGLPQGQRPFSSQRTSLSRLPSYAPTSVISSPYTIGLISNHTGRFCEVAFVRVCVAHCPYPKDSSARRPLTTILNTDAAPSSILSPSISMPQECSIVVYSITQLSFAS